MGRNGLGVGVGPENIRSLAQRLATMCAVRVVLRVLGMSLPRYSYKVNSVGVAHDAKLKYREFLKSTEYRVQSTEYRVQSTEYRIQSTEYRVAEHK